MSVTLPTTLRALGDPYSLLTLACAVVGAMSTVIARKFARQSDKGKLLDATNIAVVLFAAAAFGVNFIRLHAAAQTEFKYVPQYTVRATFTADVDEKRAVDVPFHVQRQIEVGCGSSWEGNLVQQIPQGAQYKGARAFWLQTMNARPLSAPTVEYTGDAVIARGALAGGDRTPLGFCSAGSYALLVMEGMYEQMEVAGTHTVVLSTVETTASEHSTWRIPIPTSDSKSLQCHFRVTKIPKPNEPQTNQETSPQDNFLVILRVSTSGIEAAVSGYSQTLSLVGVDGSTLVVLIK